MGRVVRVVVWVVGGGFLEGDLPKVFHSTAAKLVGHKMKLKEEEARGEEKH